MAQLDPLGILDADLDSCVPTDIITSSDKLGEEKCTSSFALCRSALQRSDSGSQCDGAGIEPSCVCACRAEAFLNFLVSASFNVPLQFTKFLLSERRMEPDT